MSHRLSEILSVGVDLVPEDMLLEPVRIRAERDAMVAPIGELLFTISEDKGKWILREF